MSLTVSTVNHSRPIVKPLLSHAEARSLHELEQLYGPNGLLRVLTTYFRTGPGAELHVGHGQYFDFDYVVSRLLELPGLNTTYGAQVYGGGKGLDLYDMYVSTLGESIERLLGSFAVFEWHDRLRYGSYRDLERQGLTCLHPSELTVFSDAQHADPHFGFDRWEEDSYLGWIPGRRLLSGADVYVPAQLVLFIYYRQEDEPRIGLAPSGGLASHICDEDAIYHAVTELFERDAVNMRWHGRVPLERIVFDVELEDRALRRALKRLDANVGQPDFYYQNLDFEQFPVVTAAQFDGWLRKLSYSAGGGVGASVEEAMCGALGEYCQTERSLRICQLARDWQFPRAFDSIFGIRPDARPEQFQRYVQAIVYYGYTENAARTEWYFRGGGEIALSELRERGRDEDPDPSARMRSMLRRREIDPIVFDFTPPAFSHARLWRAFAAELSPPYPPGSPALGHARYGTVPAASGVPGAASDHSQLLTEPLPYP